MKIGLASLAVVLVLHFPQKSDQPVPVEEEPLHKVEFKNDAVTVMRLILPPGQYTQYHIHTHDRAHTNSHHTRTKNNTQTHIPDRELREAGWRSTEGQRVVGEGAGGTMAWNV